MTIGRQDTQKAHVYKKIPSPIGELKLVASDAGLAAILWPDDGPLRVPLNIVAPCHRVIGDNGKLTGFAGGLAAKAHLLGWEKNASGGQLRWS